MTTFPWYIFLKSVIAHFGLPVVTRVLADIQRSAVSLPGNIGWRNTCGLTAEHCSHPRGCSDIERARANAWTH